MITVLDLLAQRNANINASTQLVNLSDNAEGGSRWGNRCVSFAAHFLETNASYVIAGEIWHSSSVGCDSDDMKKACSDSCNSSSLISRQVLGVMVWTE